MSTKFLKDSKGLLIFNGAQILTGIFRSLRSAHEFSNRNLQALSFACTGRTDSSGGFYLRHIHPDIEIEASDINSLKLQDYDKLCGVKRGYHSVREMAAHRRRNTKLNTLQKDMKVKDIEIINKSHHLLPSYSTKLSAGMDIRANLDEPIVLNPQERKLIPTGLYIALPEGYEAQMRPRSGLALKHGITLLNTPGTIDADYRGEIGIILINLSTEPFIINDGERICQMVVTNYTQVKWKPVAQLSTTQRDKGGFGHTGIQ